MNKFIPLFFGLMLPLTSALADSFTDEAVEFCRSKGGQYSMASMVEQGDKYCRQVTCKKTNSDKYVINEGDKGPEANVEATKQVCVAKSIVDGNFNNSGAASGSDSGSASGAAAGSASGSASGAASGSASGSASGAAAGSAAGASAGSSSGSGSGDAVTCEELEGEGVIEPGGLCYNECKPKRKYWIVGAKQSGFERKSCVECLLKYPGVYRVKKEFLPKDKDGKVIGDNSVSLGRGVTVKTGVIICKDANGKIVSATSTGACPSGTVLHTSSGSGSGGGTIIVAGGAASGSGAGAGGGINIGGSIGVAGGVGAGGAGRPAYCLSPKNKKDVELCDEWIRLNARFECSSGGNVAACTGGVSNDINARYSTTDCVNCQAGSRGKQSTWSGVAEVIGAFAPIGAAGISAYFGYKGQKAWAGAAEAGFEQCRLSQQDYMQYLQSNELPGLTPAQQANMNCNGYSLNQYAGMGGAMNGWLGAGYTPGFIGGMLGPYGNINPYGQGGYVGGAIGGAVGGMSGGLYGGYNGGYVAGGYNAGMAGGFVNGISIAGGINGGYVAGGYNGGYATGFVAGGYNAGGFNGGYVAGGYNGGYVAGGYNGGYAAGGYNAGVAGGFVNGISVAGGFNGGFNGGYVAGGYNGGYVAAGQVGGYVNGGYAQGGYAAGGYAQGGYAAGGYAQGGYAAGGFNGGYQDLANSQNAANYDRMLQQQGTGFQMGALGGGSAFFNPMNAGFGITATANANAVANGAFGGL